MIKPWQKRMWCIPPDANAGFVCQMEAVLDVYKRPFDAEYPVVCMDLVSGEFFPISIVFLMGPDACGSTV